MVDMYCRPVRGKALSSQKGVDVRDVFSCVAHAFPLQEHGHIDGHVNDFSIYAKFAKKYCEDFLIF